ncbi:CHRAC1 (predicted) [Pycnogonum litorale]
MSNNVDKLLNIPVYRIRTIMKSSPDVENIGQEALFTIARATELFVEHLAATALLEGHTGNKVDYSDLAEIVHGKQNMEFLHDIVPRKIMARDYWDILKKVEVDESKAIDDLI